MKKTIIIASSLVSAAIGAVFLAPSVIDWDRHQASFITAIEQETGCSITVKDKFQFELLPSPRLTLIQPAMLDQQGTALMKARWARAELSWRKLVQGEIRVERLELVEPSVDWDNVTSCDDATPASPGNGGNLPSGIAADEEAFSINLVSVKGGQFTYATPTGARLFQMEDLNGSFRYDPDRDQVIGDGTARIINQDANFGLTFTGLGKPERQRANLTLAQPGGGLKVTLTGRRDGLGNPITGRASLEADQLAFLGPEPFLRELPDGLRGTLINSPAKLETDFDLQDEAFQFNNFNLRLAGQTATGAIVIPLDNQGSINAALSFNHLDLDRLAQQRQIPAETALDDQAQDVAANIDTVQPKEAASAYLTQFFHRIVSPDSWRFSVDISADRVLYRSALIHDIALHVTRDKEALRLDRAEALLPGGSVLAMNGSLDSRNGIPEFIGDITFRSDDFRRFLSWTHLDPAHFSSNRLRSAAVNAQVIFSPGYLGLHALEGQVDSAKISGFLEQQSSSEQISIESRFRLDRLNLDAYGNGETLPAVWSWLQSGFKGAGPGSPGASQQTANTAPETTDPAVPTYWKTDLEIENLTSNGLPMKDVQMTIAHEEQGLMLERFQLGDLRGLGLQASGRLPSRDNNNNASLAVSFYLPDPEETAARFGASSQTRHLLRRFGPGNGSILLEGDIARLNTRLVYDGQEGWIKLDSAALWEAGELALAIRDGGIRLPDLDLRKLSGEARFQSDQGIAWQDLQGQWMDLAFVSNGTYQEGRLMGKLKMESPDINSFNQLAGNYLRAEGAVQAEMEFQSLELDAEKPLSTIQGKGTLSGAVTLTPGTELAADSKLAPIRRLREFMVTAFDGAMPLKGAISLDNGQLKISNLNLQGARGTGTAAVKLNTETMRLSGKLSLLATGQQDPEFTLQANGPADRPNLKTAGKWLAGQ
ncbi:hypothetical protein [Aestuariispira insulae]|uniref:Uncharacterized protein involved in outer membrane biogenesis n=1 Tax=Aestuariispira insulae TaxID=1461337 RepID=A0A3D9HKA4_9PROT|nr:hypothetical protein [Aestuariispira insulae]RED49701.1 uncharacterized protein involved in outer membrane biogenesis [Aestuariispira insulae]